MFADHPESGTVPRVMALLVPLSVLALALAVSPAASAEEPGIENHPETWDMTLEELQEIGLGQSRGDPVPVPADLPHRRNPGEMPEYASQGRIFVNFDGENLSGGSDDSRSNITQIGQLVGSFAAYGAGDKRDAVMQAVRADWAPFNVIITDTRPASGDYTMNMTGPTNPFGGGVLGIAPVDCGDSQTHNNITYAFHSSTDQHSATTQATTIGQEVAHSYGLEHVDSPGDIMNPFNAGGDAAFTDNCIAIVQNLYCPAQHQVECGTQSQQNSYAELITLFGPSTPDAGPPTVSITFPNDGDTFPTGSEFTITVDADDDQGVDSVTLYSNGAAQNSMASEPYGWDVNNIPAGEYEFYVTASDVAGNETMSATVTITVGDDLPPPGDDDGGDGGDGDGGDAGGDGPGDGGDDGSDDGPLEEDDGSLPPGYGRGLGEDSAAAGCTCRSQSSRGGPQGGPAAFALLGLLLLGSTRRRPHPQPQMTE